MSQRSFPMLPLLLLLAVLAVIGGAVAWTVLAASNLPSGPVDLVFDKAACAACGMHVGEPAFAAQLTDKSGRTHAFDDPGCLFLYVEEHHPDVHAIWFRHWREPRWIAGDRVAFARVEVTPMGFGIGAVDGGTAGAIGYDEARRKCLERTSGDGGK
ncbi:MAG: hypothetical protein IPK26_09450 [Planctomycetes bacterium]|nr:hypothetical protein [Planctomycetota bacterium]